MIGWVKGERMSTNFFLKIFRRIEDQILVIDPIGESVILVCPDATYVPKVHQALVTASAAFPDISVSAVGIRVPEIKVWSIGQWGLFINPSIDERFGWLPLESLHKQRVINGRLGGISFVIKIND